MSKYTPGPWTIDKNVTETNYLICCHISDRNRGYVATLAVTNEDALSNAQLISAAPDLLAALYACTCAMQLKLDFSSRKDEPELVDALDKARAAIRKGEGE